MADISLFLGGWAYKSHELAQINIPYERKKIKNEKKTSTNQLLSFEKKNYTCVYTLIEKNLYI